MFIKIDASAVLYQQIYQALRRAILTGQLAPGARLPSTRALAHELRVSRNAVLLAYELLLAEGYAAGRPGSGTYVASTLPEALLTPLATTRPAVPIPHGFRPRLSTFGQRVVHTSSHLAPGTMPHAPAVRYDFRYGLPSVEEFPADLWRRLLARRARRTSVRSLHYGPPEGYGPLRVALADYLRRARAVVCTAEQIVVVNGSQQALDLAARVLIDPQDRVMLEEPHYLGARLAFLGAGAALYTVPVDAEGLDTSQLPDPALGVRLAYVTPSHQFPSGAIMSLTRRFALLAWAERADAYVLEDDYDSEYRYEGRPLEAVQGLDRSGRVIYVGTFSKVLSPALRLGYLVLPQALVQPFIAAKWLTDRHTPTLEQEVLTDFITEGHFERHLRRTRTRNAARRAVLLDALSSNLGTRVEITGANAGMHLLLWFNDLSPRGLDTIIAAAAHAGVGVYAVAPCYTQPPQRAGLLLGYTGMSETDIRAGIQRLARVVKENT
jgi:GntR family transcriptional regulator/MocR family aminotransferase